MTGKYEIQKYIEALKDKHLYMRKLAVEALCEMGPDARAAVPALIKALKDKDWDVRWWAASALGNIGPNASAAIPALIKALKDKDWYVGPMDWCEGPMALGSIPDATQVVIEASNKGWRVKSFKPKGRDMHEAATAALRKIGEPAVPTLIKALKDKNINWRVTMVLGDIGSNARAAVPALIKALMDKDWALRWRAAWALGKMGPNASAAVPTLIKALKDEDKNVRENAAWALGDIGPDASVAVPTLIKALKDEDKNVRERQAYCMKCRTKREMKDAKSITMKNGKPATQGVCPVCGSKIFRIGKA